MVAPVGVSREARVAQYLAKYVEVENSKARRKALRFNHSAQQGFWELERHGPRKLCQIYDELHQAVKSKVHPAEDQRIVPRRLQLRKLTCGAFFWIDGDVKGERPIVIRAIVRGPNNELHVFASPSTTHNGEYVDKMRGAIYVGGHIAWLAEDETTERWHVRRFYKQYSRTNDQQGVKSMGIKVAVEDRREISRSKESSLMPHELREIDVTRLTRYIGQKVGPASQLDQVVLTIGDALQILSSKDVDAQSMDKYLQTGSPKSLMIRYIDKDQCPPRANLLARHSDIFSFRECERLIESMHTEHGRHSASIARSAPPARPVVNLLSGPESFMRCLRDPSLTKVDDYSFPQTAPLKPSGQDKVDRANASVEPDHAERPAKRIKVDRQANADEPSVDGGLTLPPDTTPPKAADSTTADLRAKLANVRGSNLRAEKNCDTRADATRLRSQEEHPEQAPAGVPESPRSDEPQASAGALTEQSYDKATLESQIAAAGREAENNKRKFDEEFDE